MEEVSLQIESTTLDKTGTVVVDIESLSQLSDRSLGSPKKITRALSRKWSYRAEKLSINEDEEGDEPSKRTTLVRVNSQVEHLKQQPLMNNKAPPINAGANMNSCGSTCSMLDSADGKNKRFNRFTSSINPRRILLFFATLSSMGTLILIYFTLEINTTKTS